MRASNGGVSNRIAIVRVVALATCLLVAGVVPAAGTGTAGAAGDSVPDATSGGDADASDGTAVSWLFEHFYEELFGWDDDASTDRSVYERANVSTQSPDAVDITSDLRTTYERERGDGDDERVIVHVELPNFDESSFEPPANATEEERNDAYKRALQRHADETQAPVERVVAELEGAKVATTLWLGNSVIVESDPGQVDLDTYARIDGVERLRGNVETRLP